MQYLFLSAVYLVFFLSGAAALIYEVVWVRYLSLIMGGSHLAVTTVLAVFMGGLALGSYTIGKRASGIKKLLRFYGLLELGIALFALVFVLLMSLYPSVYVPLARVAPTSAAYLSFLRAAFAAIAMIIPTTLMGGTLPVLSSLVSGREKDIGVRLSFLYGFNTLGAVAGCGAAGFIFLRYFSASTTLYIAVAVNVFIGLLAILLQGKAKALPGPEPSRKEVTPVKSVAGQPGPKTDLPFRLVIWGIGISGFCALGYEVLWTRILCLAVAASVYGFAIMLMAFLSGIAAGSTAYGAFIRLTGKGKKEASASLTRQVFWFGLVQVIIGITALIVTIYIGSLPMRSSLLHSYFKGLYTDSFQARQWADMVIAFLYMFVPAFFMGVAFPLAGSIHAGYKKTVGQAVGEVLAFNTVGAILGTIVSGFVLVYLVGIERSLQVLTLVNIGFGIIVIVSIRAGKAVITWVSAAVAASILAVLLSPGAWKLWDTKMFATFVKSKQELYLSPEWVHDYLQDTEVLYYAEGVNTIVSSIREKCGVQAFLTNGRPEASNKANDIQCQYTLGHLPMLLHKGPPRSVFVLGTGSGMTLWATSTYPEVEKITLAEIEPKVLGVTRTFHKYNHDVLDDPRLHIFFEDGRNFLLTTSDKFDVVTADPVHPWFSGSGYLYTREYFKLVSEHLNPGGVACQWLPIYELTVDDLKSVVKTFSENFRYTMVWLTYADAELVGSDSPIVLDEDELDRKIKGNPAVLGDLMAVNMGSADAFLSYFVMGNEGVREFCRGGKTNTDDNLYLEFSAPRNIGNNSLMASDMLYVTSHRESILPYLLLPADKEARAKVESRWNANLAAAYIADKAHVKYMGGILGDQEFNKVTGEVNAIYPGYAPWQFLVHSK